VTTTPGGLSIRLFDQHSPRAAELQRLLGACDGPEIELVSAEDLSRVPDGS
jgi:hypothetical protein